jgi:hypothetical protein
MAGLPSTNVQLIVVNYCRMAGPTARYRAMQLRLRPVCSLEIEYNNIGEVLAVLVLSAKDQQLAPLPQTCGMSHSYSWNIPIIVYQIPLPRCEIKSEHMVVHFIRVLVEPSKGVDLIIAYVGDRRIDKAGGLGTDGRDHLGLIALDGGSAIPGRTGRHEESVITRAIGNWRMCTSG